jgi:hypothetical protein
MGIQEIPDSYAAFSRWYTDFEDKHMRYHPDNDKLLQDTLDNAFAKVPTAWLRALLKSVTLWVLPGLLGDRASVALGLDPPSWAQVAVVETPLILRKYILRYLMLPRATPRTITVSYCRSHSTIQCVHLPSLAMIEK